MNLKFKNNLVIVEGHYNSLSIGIFDKTKLIKVKNYNFSLTNNNEDFFFNSVKDFLRRREHFKTIYYGMGPGSFTNIRRIISFVKAISTIGNKNSLFQHNVVGVNNLTILGFYYLKNYPLNKKDFVLPILENSKSIVTQLYKINHKKNFPLEKLSDIEFMFKEDIFNFLRRNNVKIENTNLICISENNKFSIRNEKIKTFPKLFLGETLYEIAKIVDNRLIKSEKYKDIFQNDLKPLYAKEPNTN